MNSDRRMAIIGGRGMLGTDLQQAARQHGFTVGVFDLPEFDITNKDHLRRAIADHDVIVNCAAYTNVDGAESNPETAYAVNAAAVEELGRLAAEMDKYVIHISTDFVFDGRKDGAYDETDAPNPLGMYGKTKLKGEQLLTQTGCRQAIVRIQWTYGKAGNNFVTKMIQLAKSGKALKVIDDQIGSPTATAEVALRPLRIPRSRPTSRRPLSLRRGGLRQPIRPGTLHLRHIKAECRPVTMQEHRLRNPGQAPLNSRFDCRKIQRYLKKPVRPWQEPLAEFLEKI